MNTKFLLLLCFLLPACVFAQVNADENLPKGFTEEELESMKWYDFHQATEKFGIDTPPPGPVRTMAEWEEIQALCVTWTQYRPTVADIIRHAKEEVEVLVICDNISLTQSQLLNTYNLPNLDNVSFIQAEYNSIWMRDYGPNTVYTNDVDSLAIVDWIYNRPRPKDDLVPDAIGEFLDVPVYSTITAPSDLVNTGGNFNADGMGTAFASDLILDENAQGNPYDVTTKSEEQIDAIMQEWMGIDRYIKMETLPYDVIHHIDMHMKLLDEETLLIGEYPQGVADGPQIEENKDYVLNNFNSSFGTPYKIVRIPMPPQNGSYPNTNGDYRTYTNSVFVNKTILVPTYQEQYDTTALRIYRENMPGYKVVGINCNSIIQSLGALHCITRAVGVADPLLIIHQEHPDVSNADLEDFEINATIQHRTGISNAQLYWTTDTLAGYASLEMTLVNEEENLWSATIPNQGQSGKYFYYIEAEANSGKTQVRPIVAPQGYFDFVSIGTVGNEEVAVVQNTAGISIIAPNPTRGQTYIEVTNKYDLENTKISIIDVLGRTKEVLMDEVIRVNSHSFYVDFTNYAQGVYFVRLENGDLREVEILLVN